MSVNAVRRLKLGDSALEQVVTATLSDIEHSSDEACVALSRAMERQYLLSHLGSLRQNLRFMRQGLALAGNPDRACVVDIGTSPLTFAYRRSLPRVTLSTLDLTDLLARRCLEAGIDHHVCDLTGDPLPFGDGQIDMVVFTEVLEHLNTGPGRAFSEIGRILRPGGMLVFSLPNTAVLKNRVRALLGHPVLSPVYVVFKEEVSEYSHGGGQWIHGLGHVREYTMSETIDIVRHYGFALIADRSIDPSVRKPAGLPTARRLLWPLYRLASGVVPHARAINLVLAQWAPSGAR